ncbi:hypothetical protein M427DRAFT_56842 [Gonapodya prolifera JEL478]|uniref:Opi1-domain-containing protein n=1 Tax=Gonapodya prolifera (strain JEL478) TaxID=1344416 RepID=A0A139AEL0_GONPJ|nr:hypothetical protein M427DRAFT_56842 [Gonapodya prolifera JEL478]|eukprot:KXS15207.1 hypothetical protein M427DRAFT_56842 [Gonapodya prolifera JEL478]
MSHQNQQQRGTPTPRPLSIRNLIDNDGHDKHTDMSDPPPAQSDPSHMATPHSHQYSHVSHSRTPSTFSDSTLSDFTLHSSTHPQHSTSHTTLPSPSESQFQDHDAALLLGSLRSSSSLSSYSSSSLDHSSTSADFHNHPSPSLSDADLPPQPYASRPGSAFVSRISTSPFVAPLGPLARQLGKLYVDSKERSSIVRLGAGAVEKGVKAFEEAGWGKEVGEVLDTWGVKAVDKLEQNLPPSFRPPSTPQPSSSSSPLLTPPSVPLPTTPLCSTAPPAPIPSFDHRTGLSITASSEPPDATYSHWSPSTAATRAARAVGLLPSHRGHVQGQEGRGLEVERGVAYAVGWIEQAMLRLHIHIRRLRSLLAALARAAERAVDWIDPPEGGTGEGPSRAIAGKEHGQVEGGDQDFEGNPLALISASRHDIALVLRRLVDLVGRFAALYLPEEARRFVRGVVVAAARRWVGNPQGVAPGGASSSAGASGGRSSDQAREEGERVIAMAEEARGVMGTLRNVFGAASPGRAGAGVGSPGVDGQLPPLQMRPVDVPRGDHRARTVSLSSDTMEGLMESPGPSGTDAQGEPPAHAGVKRRHSTEGEESGRQVGWGRRPEGRGGTDQDDGDRMDVDGGQ